MSAFLGPIHYRMFDKAQSVRSIAQQIAEHADAQGWTTDLAARLDTEYPKLIGDVADNIDLSEIHASLSDLVAQSEDALQFACAPLVGHVDELAEFAYSLGAQAAATVNLADAELKDVWNAIDERWLDGMPCDGYMRFIDNDPSLVAWTIDLAPHAQVGYESIRSAWTKGFAEASGVSIEADGSTFRIQKAA